MSDSLSMQLYYWNKLSAGPRVKGPSGVNIKCRCKRLLIPPQKLLFDNFKVSQLVCVQNGARITSKVIGVFNLPVCMISTWADLWWSNSTS